MDVESEVSTDTLREPESLTDPDDVRLRERTFVWDPDSEGLWESVGERLGSTDDDKVDERVASRLSLGECVAD